MRRPFAPLAAVALVSCAPLNTQTMSDGCRREYNACLSSCDKSSMRAPPEARPGNPPPVNRWNEPMADKASCTRACNERFQDCR